MITIVNQRKYSEIRQIDFLTFANKAVKLIPENQNYSATIVFSNDLEVKKLNSSFRGKDTTTDVLSFPNRPDEFNIDTDQLGDIVISIQQSKRQAFENNLSIVLELKQLILHGILHLCGYDHETDDGEMNELELALREKLKINE